MKANKHEINGYIYVTSEEEINYKTEPFYSTIQNNIQWDIKREVPLNEHYKKIILCNNPNLPIQQLSTEEVEYLKSVDSFEVTNLYGDFKPHKIEYKILITQETKCKFIGDCENKCLTHCLEKTLQETELILCGEADKFYQCVTCDAPCGSEGHYIEKEQPKESIEEVAENYAQSKSSSSVFQEAHKTDFLNGYNYAKQTLYTEEESLELLLNCISENPIDVRQWFNKHKKQ